MNNCIASYAESAVAGRCYLFHVTHDGEEASVEIDPERPRTSSRRPGQYREPRLALGGATARRVGERAPTAGRRVADAAKRGERSRRRRSASSAGPCRSSPASRRDGTAAPPARARSTSARPLAGSMMDGPRLVQPIEVPVQEGLLHAEDGPLRL